MTPSQLSECVVNRVRKDACQPLRPVATIIEGGNDYKGLLSEGIEEN